jgi:hypothetical protein
MHSVPGLADRVSGVIAFVVGVASAGAALAQAAPGTLAWPPMGTVVTIDRTIASGSYGDAGGDFGGPAGRLSWKFERREWKGRTVVAAVSSGDKSPLFDPDTGATVAVLDRDGSPLWSFEPGVKWADWPLEVGKTWTAEYGMTEHRATSLKFVVPRKVVYQVDAEEEVTTPAGTYKAFKVISTSGMGSTEQHWVVPSLGLFGYFAVKGIEERPPSNLFGAGRREWQLISRTVPAR